MPRALILALRRDLAGVSADVAAFKTYLHHYSGMSIVYESRGSVYVPVGSEESRGETESGGFAFLRSHPSQGREGWGTHFGGSFGRDAGPSTALPPHRTGALGAPGLRFGRDDKFMGAMRRVLAPGDLLRTY